MFIDNDIARDPIEAAGHEAFHYWSNSLQRSAFRGVIDDNVIFSAKEFADFQNKISKDYFDEEISLDDGRWEMLSEEIHAYITGYVYSGDADNVVRPFLRDYDAVKNAVDAFFDSQRNSDTSRTGKKNDTKFNAISKGDKKYREKVNDRAGERVKKEREKAKAYAKEKIAEAKEQYNVKAAYGKAYTCE